MAKSKVVAGKGNKKSKAIVVFDILFLLFSLLLVVGAVLLFTPLQNRLPSPAEGLVDTLYEWVNSHILIPFNRSRRVNLQGFPSKPFTIAFFFWLLFLIAVIFLFLLFVPFSVRSANKAKGKKQAYRKVFGWLSFFVILICGCALFAQLYREQRAKIFGSAYSWFNDLVDKVALSFEKGRLSPLKLSAISKNAYFNAFSYAFFILLALEIIRLRICGLGKGKEEVQAVNAEKGEANAPLEEETSAEAVPYLPSKVALAAKEAEKQKGEKREATYHDVKLLDRLENIHPDPISDLPGIESTDISQIVTTLGNEGIVPKENVEGEKILHRIDHLSATVQVLPGIDEWKADPWKDEKEVTPDRVETIKPVAEMPSSEEAVKPGEPINDITSAAEPETDKEVNVVRKEEKEEAEKPCVPIILAINDDLNDGKRPQELRQDVLPKEEKKSRYEERTLLTDNTHQQVETKPVGFNSTWILPDYEEKGEPVNVREEAKKSGPVILSINSLPIDNLRPQEEEHEKSLPEEKTSRYEERTTIQDNSHTAIESQESAIDNTWNLPTYIAPKPRGSVKKVDLAPVGKPSGLNTAGTRKPITPIKPVTPVAEPKKEEPEEATPEPKIIAPLAGPLHSTAKSKHEKIQAVKARRVPFVLQNYQLKTYKGDLTPEQAFFRGVTKVQPTARPIFANQGNESAWKQKRREEEIRKNGYSDVTKVDKLNGKVEAASPLTPNGLSIRERRNALKAEKAKAAEEKAPENEEKKPSVMKPITPLKPVEPMKRNGNTSVPEEKKDVHPSPAPFFHPLAPINKKPSKRPEIKPVDPLAKKK